MHRRANLVVTIHSRLSTKSIHLRSIIYSVGTPPQIARPRVQPRFVTVGLDVDKSGYQICTLP